MQQDELLRHYFELYKKQTEAKCPFYQPKLKSKLQGMEMKNMILFDNFNYRRIYSPLSPSLECSVLYVDELESFDGIPEYTIVVAKQIFVTSPSHIVITSERTVFETVPLSFGVDDIVIKHFVNYSKKFHIPELLDLHAIDAFVPLKEMDRFVALLDALEDVEIAIQKCTTYPGSSRLRIYQDDELDVDISNLNLQDLPSYNLKTKIENYKQKGLKQFGCPFPRQEKESCPFIKNK